MALLELVADLVAHVLGHGGTRLGHSLVLADDTAKLSSQRHFTIQQFLVPSGLPGLGQHCHAGQQGRCAGRADTSRFHCRLLMTGSSRSRHISAVTGPTWR